MKIFKLYAEVDNGSTVEVKVCIVAANGLEQAKQYCVTELCDSNETTVDIFEIHDVTDRVGVLLHT